MKKLLIISLLITICHFSNGQSNYFPLEKGATFIYGYGSELYQGAYDKMRFKINILNTTKVIEGKEYFIFENFSGSVDNYNLITTSYARLGEDGAILTRQKEGEQEFMTMQASPKVDDRWTSDNGGFPTTIRVTDLDGSIKTANKTYTNCLVMEQKNEQGIITKSYFKEGLGMVATTMVTEGSEKIFIYLMNE